MPDLVTDAAAFHEAIDAASASARASPLSPPRCMRASISC